MYKIIFSDLSEVNIPLVTGLALISDGKLVKALTSFWRGAKNLLPAGIRCVNCSSVYGNWSVSSNSTDTEESPEKYLSKALFFAKAGEMQFEAVVPNYKEDVNWLRKVSRLPVLTSNMNNVLKDCSLKQMGKRNTLVDGEGKQCSEDDVCNEDYFLLMQTSLIHKTGKDLNVIFLDTTGFEDLQTLVKSVCMLTEKTIIGYSIILNLHGENSEKIYNEVLKLRGEATSMRKKAKNRTWVEEWEEEFRARNGRFVDKKSTY